MSDKPKVEATFRDVPDDYLPPTDYPVWETIPPLEVQTRRARFALVESMMRAFDTQFDAAPYTYSDLLSEAIRTLQSERQRVRK